jgi:protein HOOK3
LVQAQKKKQRMTRSIKIVHFFHIFPTHFPFSFRDDDFYRIQSEKSVIINQKYELQRQFEELERSQATLQKDYDEAVTEKEKLAKRLEVLDQHESDLQRSDKADAYMRSEIDRLRTELYVQNFSLLLRHSL